MAGLAYFCGFSDQRIVSRVRFSAGCFVHRAEIFALDHDAHRNVANIWAFAYYNFGDGTYACTYK